MTEAPSRLRALLLKGHNLEFGAIMRGPITGYGSTNYFVFAINRGEGAQLGPVFSSRPGITPDALVTVAVGPYAQSISGTITDLTTGAVQSINPNQIQVAGPAVRVLVTPASFRRRGSPSRTIDSPRGCRMLPAETSRPSAASSPSIR